MIAESTIKIIAVVAVAMFSVACSQGKQPELENELRDIATRFIPADASDQTHASGIPWVQISFNALRGPDEFAVPTELMARAQAAGWAVCQPSTLDWVSYEDHRVSPSVYTRQRTYVLYGENSIITLLGTYYSESEQAWRRESGASAKLTQQGVIIVRKSDEQEAQAVAKEHNLKCDRSAKS